MEAERRKALGEELYRAARSRSTVDPITARQAEVGIEDAYAIAEHFVALRLRDGETVVGRKIGVTSKAVQSMLGVHQPDFGTLTDAMVCAPGEPVPIGSQLIQPRAEGEIAFLLGRDLTGPGVTNAEVLRATEGVMPCFEIVDSRIRDWKIAIQDTIADNASCGLFATGSALVSPRRVDLSTCGMVLEKNGEVVATGAGAAALGSPVNCVTWLANTLGRFGISLRSGDIILSGSLVPLIPVAPGDSMHLAVAGLGEASLVFS